MSVRVGNVLYAWFLHSLIFIPFWVFICFLYVFFSKFSVHCWLSVAAVDAGQKVYGCALPPGYGSEDSQVLLHYCYFLEKSKWWLGELVNKTIPKTLNYLSTDLLWIIKFWRIFMRLVILGLLLDFVFILQIYIANLQTMTQFLFCYECLWLLLLL